MRSSADRAKLRECVVRMKSDGRLMSIERARAAREGGHHDSHESRRCSDRAALSVQRRLSVARADRAVFGVGQPQLTDILATADLGVARLLHGQAGMRRAMLNKLVRTAVLALLLLGLT